MIIKVDNIRSVLPEELVMITNIFNEIREKQNKIFNCFNKQDKNMPPNSPRK